MGNYKFVKARTYKDYWIINELVEHCNEEGKDGRFRWCGAAGERTTLPYIELSDKAKLVVTNGRDPRIVGFYTYDAAQQRLDVLYVVPKMRGRDIALEMVEDFIAMFSEEKELYVLMPCLAVRRMLNKHFQGVFRAIEVDPQGPYVIHFADEDLSDPESMWWARSLA